MTPKELEQLQQELEADISREIMAMNNKIGIDKKNTKFLQKLAKSAPKEYVKILNFVWHTVKK